MADKQNILWIANDIEGLWADALYLAILTLIIIIVGIITHSIDRFIVGVSEINKILSRILTFSQLQITNKFKKT